MPGEVGATRGASDETQLYDKRFRTCSWCSWWQIFDHLATVSSNFSPSPQFLHRFPWVVGLCGNRTMSTWCAAGWQQGKRRQRWQRCGPIGQSPISRKLVARLRAAGGDTGAVYSRQRSFTAVSSDQVDEQGWWRTLRGPRRPISMAPCAKTRTNGVYGVFFLFRGRIQRWSTQVTLSPVFICNQVCVFFGSCSSFVTGSAC